MCYEPKKKKKGCKAIVILSHPAALRGHYLRSLSIAGEKAIVTLS